MKLTGFESRSGEQFVLGKPKEDCAPIAAKIGAVLESVELDSNLIVIGKNCPGFDPQQRQIDEVCVSDVLGFSQVRQYCAPVAMLTGELSVAQVANLA